MKKLSCVLGLLFMPLVINSLKADQFQPTNDTLTLKTEKHPGYGMHSGGFSKLHLEAIANDDDLLNRIPSDITDPEFGREYIDFKVWHYGDLKQNAPQYLQNFLETWYPEKIDTANLPSVVDNTLKVIIGRKDGQRVFIVDQNNNQDFRDDPVHELKSISASVLEPPLQCRYRIYNGHELVEDLGWVFIGQMTSGTVGVSAAQHIRSSFTLGNHAYSIEVMNSLPYVRWCFESPIISITAQDGIQKDSLLFSEQLELGEYLELGGSYYRFANVANDGSTVTLVREDDISDKIGTQPGFLAPDFSAVTTSGDSLALNDFHGQYLLLTNITACWSKKMSYEYYKELWDDYQSKMAIIAIDESPNALQVNIDELGLEGKFIIGKNNPSIKKSYREDYCSRVCFLIDPNGRIVDRFEIADWQESLAKHFE
ncbi:MAG: hypothetical protein R2824_08225 [Saprospiraceae bacterium]|nr:hypothetical protein [Lewinella sp.]